MKSVFILQNSHIPYDMNPAKLYQPNQYKLYFITDENSYQHMLLNKDEKFFEDVYKINNFSLEEVSAIINQVIDIKAANLKDSLEIITEAEECVLLCGELRKKYKLSNNGYERFISKPLMKKLLAKSEIKTPAFVLFDRQSYRNNKTAFLSTITEALTFPLLVKPTNQASCTAIEKFYDLSSFEAWCEKNLSSNYEFEIDSFIDGTLYHCDSFFRNGKIQYTQVSRYSHPCYSFIEGQTKGSIALRPTEEDSKNLTVWVEKVFKYIDPPENGLTHLEVFKNKQGEFVFLEVAFRAGGVIIPKMYKTLFNIDIVTYHLLLQLDRELNVSIKYDTYAAWLAFPLKTGTLKQFNPINIKSQYELTPYYNPGDKLGTPKKGRDYIATIFLWNKDYEQLEKDFCYLSEFQLFEVAS